MINILKDLQRQEKNNHEKHWKKVTTQHALLEDRHHEIRAALRSISDDETGRKAPSKAAAD